MPDAATMTFMKLKAVMVGARKVGKTTIVRSWAGLPIYRDYRPTDVEEVTVIYRQYMDDVVFEVHDVAGDVTEEQAAAILDQAHGVILVYKYRYQPSIEMLDKVWLPRIRAYCRKDIHYFFAANQDYYMRPSPHNRPLSPNETYVYQKLPTYTSMRLHFYSFESLEKYSDVMMSRVFEGSWSAYVRRRRGEFKWCHFL